MKRLICFLILLLIVSCTEKKEYTGDADGSIDGDENTDEIQDADSSIDFNFDEGRFFETVSNETHFFAAKEKDGIFVFSKDTDDLYGPVSVIDLDAIVLIAEKEILYAGGVDGVSVVDIKDVAVSSVIFNYKTDGYVTYLSKTDSQLYAVSKNTDGKQHLYLFNINDYGSIINTTSYEVKEEMFQYHISGNIFFSFESDGDNYFINNDDSYFINIWEITFDGLKKISTFSIPQKVGEMRCLPWWFSVYENTVYLFMIDANYSTVQRTPENISLAIDVSDPQQPFLVGEIGVDAPLTVRKSGGKVFFIQPYFSPPTYLYSNAERCYETDVSDPENPLNSQVYFGTDISALGEKRLTTHYSHGLKLYNDKDNPETLDHRDILSSALNVDVFNNVAVVRTLEGRVLFVDLKDVSKPELLKDSVSLSISSESNHYYFDGKAIYSCQKSSRSSAPEITKYLISEDFNFSSSRIYVRTFGSDQYRNFQIDGNVVMIIPEIYEHDPPVIADISGEEALVYDNSEMVEAKHYSLNNRRIAAVEETDLKLYEISSENMIVKVSSTKIDSSTGAVLLRGSYIYTVFSGGMMVFETVSQKIIEKESVKVEWTSEVPEKIKNIGDLLIVGNANSLKIFDIRNMSGPFYTVDTKTDNIYDFTIFEDMSITANGESGLFFNEFF